MHSLFLRLSRPSATSNVALLWVFIMINLGTFLTFNSVLEDFQSAVLIPSLISSGLFIAIVIATRGLLRSIPNQGRRSLAVLVVITVAWLIRSVIFTSLLPEYPSFDSRLPVIRSGMGVIYISFIMSIMSEVIDRRSSHMLILKDLNVSSSQLKDMLATFDDRLRQAQTNLKLAIHDVIEPSALMLDRIFSAEKNPQQSANSAEKLRNILRRNIRPALEDLAFTLPPAARPDSKRSGALRISRNIDIPDSIRPVIMVVPIRVFTLSVFLTYTNTANAFFSFFILLLSWPVLAVVRRFWPQRIRALPVVRAVMTLSLIFFVAFGVPSLLMLRLSPDSLALFRPLTVALSILFPIAIAWCIAIPQIIERRRRRLEQELQDANEQIQISISQMSQELWFYRRSLIWVIHGPVQSALLSAVLKFESSDSASQSESEMSAMRQRIDEAYASVYSDGMSRIDFSEFIESLQQLWDGFCTINVVDPTGIIAKLQAYPSAAAAATEVIRESVGNAVRHGSATEVSVCLDSTVERLVSIEIVDNGSGLDEDASPGLGSELFDSLALRWSRSHSDRGTIVCFEFVWSATLD